MKDISNYSGPVQLLLRSLENTEAANPLIVLPPEPGIPDLLEKWHSRVSYQYFDYSVYLRDCKSKGQASWPSLTFSWSWSTESPYDLACIFLPKGRPAAEYVFSGISSLLAQGTNVQVVGAKKSGIVSSRDLLERYFGEVISSLRGRHSVLWRARKCTPAPRFEGEVRFEVSLYGSTFEVVTLPGTFSYGRLDEGTAFLLEHFEPGEVDRVLDFGCGSGVIGTAVQLYRKAARVDFIDNNVMALESTRRTLEANGLPSTSVGPSDVLSAVSGRYDLIITNPPFHTGLATDFTITQRLIEMVSRHLSSNGRLVLVANSFIDYDRHLKPRFGQVTTLARDRRFKVIEAGKPRLYEEPEQQESKRAQHRDPPQNRHAKRRGSGQRPRRRRDKD
jgi:16S rRNA (guanine1207-N2)-methyltransferase